MHTRKTDSPDARSEDDQRLIDRNVELYPQFFLELITTQLENLHGVTAIIFTYHPHHAIQVFT